MDRFFAEYLVFEMTKIYPGKGDKIYVSKLLFLKSLLEMSKTDCCTVCTVCMG